VGNSIAFDLRSADVNSMQARIPLSSLGNVASKTKIEGRPPFDLQAFLDSANLERRVVEFGSRATVFTQGDPATSVLYIRKGAVKLSVVNEVGKEAVTAILGPTDFIGEGCLAGQSQRVSTATTITNSTILVMDKLDMIRVLHAHRSISDQFINYLLSRKIRVEEDLVDQLFNISEKRLARTLLLLACNGKQDNPQRMVAEISQEMLAEMVGTTRPRVCLFMNKFRKLGFIEYGKRLRGLQIKKSLLSVVQH
jgi:CRP/FNR family transcriptional regulator, cyclic AMP receptor protein